MAGYLYRGLSAQEIKEGKLIPDLAMNFSPLLIRRYALGMFRRVDNRQHREMEGIRHQRGERTSGISTTTSFDVAVRYATHNGTKDGVVAKISRTKLLQYEIREHPVSFLKPEDCEVVIYRSIEPRYFPKEIIEEFIRVLRNGTTY